MVGTQGTLCKAMLIALRPSLTSGGIFHTDTYYLLKYNEMLIYIVRDGESLWIKARTAKEYMKYIVPKGFICVDGTSLTICETS